LMNVVVGVRGVPQDQRDLLRLWNASAWQTFYQLELPSALPILLTGLKTSATLALIGSVVGEFVSAKQGLGFLVNLARAQYDTALVFVVVFTMTALSLSLYTLVSMLEWRLLKARRHSAD
jgi:NitT/TauT family transport system permease protein